MYEIDEDIKEMALDMINGINQCFRSYCVYNKKVGKYEKGSLINRGQSKSV